MTMSTGIILVVTLLLAGGMILLRKSKLQILNKFQKILISTLVGIGTLFLVWLALMVFVVGPSMRAI